VEVFYFCFQNSALFLFRAVILSADGKYGKQRTSTLLINGGSLSSSWNHNTL